jgi:hypothetical protein
MSETFRKANLFLGLLAFMVWKEKYLEMAVNHNMAINLEASDLKKQFEAGKFPPPNWNKEYLSNAQMQYKVLSKSIYGSFFIAVLVFTLVFLAFIMGLIGSNIELSNLKTITFIVGVFIAFWGALVPLNPVEESYCKTTLPENLHSFIVKILLVFGVILTLYSGLL